MMEQIPELTVDPRALRRALNERDILFAELEHRTRNNLQMVVGFIALAAKRAEHPEAKAVLQDVMRRVQMVDAAERALFKRGAFERVELAEFLPEVVKELMALDGRPGVKAEFAVEPVETSVRQASALGLVVNELATNALKHAFPGGHGRLMLELRRSGDMRALIVVADTGVGIAKTASATKCVGMGTQIIEGLCQQAEAVLELTSNAGTRAVLEFEPVPNG
jgi:two-component sensor histidine kinase